jgi:aminocarboxymuconate-semialdehyde decarboxylase
MAGSLRIVDVHAHFYPRAYLDLLSRSIAGERTAWARAVQTLLDTRFTVEPRMVNIEAHLEDMDRTGVSVEVLSLSVPMSYFEDEDDAVTAARIVNEALAEICARYPARFKGLASLPLPHTDAALQELDRAIGTLGLHGVGLGANVRGRYHLDDDRFLPIYREINRRRLTVFLHPAIPPGLEEMLDYDLWVGAGFLMDSALATLRLAYRGVFEENPDLNFIVPHLGTFLLSGWDRVQGFSRRAQAAGLLRRPVGDSLRRLYYDSVNSHRPFWTCALDTVGADHIVFGTDYPFVPAQSVMDGIARVQALPIAPAEREAILGGTADRLFPAGR